MPDIVLTTLNARYSHASFGLRYLMANLGDLREQAVIREFDLQRPLEEVRDEILRESPRIVGIGVYIWNTGKIFALVDLIRRSSPDTVIILGGPEVSFETEQQTICAKADYVLCGEADLLFAQYCRRILDEDLPDLKTVQADPPSLSDLVLPYDLYDEEDVTHRLVYVEASRGCPFHCEYCLSSMDDTVRRFDLDRLFPAFQSLLERGVRQFKFVDRTFNLHIDFCIEILDFFLSRYTPGLFLHFEMIPDRMPERLASKLREFPRGSLQLELGIQTFNEEVADRIQRIQQNDRIETNMRFLREETEAYIHADLIAGLPGEDMQSFAKGFDRLAALSPHEIQVGVLKRLRGTPIARHDEEWAMIYSPEPPYNLIENRLMSPGDMARIDAFAQLWDKICNSGNFIETAPLLWLNEESVFDAFMRWSDWYVQQVGQRHSIPLDDLCSAVFTYLTTERRVGVNAICGPMLRDYQRGRRRGAPGCLRPHLAEIPRYQFDIPHLPQGLKRQTRHLTFCATSN